MTRWPHLPVQAAYLHIPFCVKKCTYCDFVSFPAVNTTKKASYVKALACEIDQVAQEARRQGLLEAGPLDSVYFGGGTPTVLEIRSLVLLLDRVNTAFGVNPSGEITIEANPGTVTRNGLYQLREAGFNRISFGFQAAQPRLLRLLGRIHQAEDFDQAVEWAVSAGFTNINADILFGLPGQSISDVEQTLAVVISKPVTHISYYGLILEEGTPLAEDCAAGRFAIPDDEHERDQYHVIRRFLEKHRFSQYEISNSARHGYRCRHNEVYWDARPYFGLGLAAHGYVHDHRFAHDSNLDRYIELFTSPRKTRSDSADQETLFPGVRLLETLSVHDAMVEMMILGLRRIEGVLDTAFQERFGCSFFSVFSDVINELCRRDLLIKESDRVRLSLKGLDLANQVFMAFMP